MYISIVGTVYFRVKHFWIHVFNFNILHATEVSLLHLNNTPFQTTHDSNTEKWILHLFDNI